MNIILATILFIALSPGLLITIPNIVGSIFDSGATNNVAVLVHAILFFTIQKLASLNNFPFKYLNDVVKEISNTVRDVPSIIATVLFIILSPGVLLTFPPNSIFSIFMSQQTNLLAILFHATLYFIILYYYFNGLNNPNVKWFNEQIKNI